MHVHAGSTAPAFRASDALFGSLQAVLVDLIERQLQGEQAHWNVVGKNFRDLHLQLDEIVDAAPGLSDQIAERMRALRATPNGRSATVARHTSLAPLPDRELDTATVVDLIGERLLATSRTLRAVHDHVDREDPTTGDILHQIIEQLEKFGWRYAPKTGHPARTRPSRENRAGTRPPAGRSLVPPTPEERCSARIRRSPAVPQSWRVGSLPIPTSCGFAGTADATHHR
jgi:starvation-inducible DNA-binding protein